MAGIVLFVMAAGVFPLPQHQRYRSDISVIPDGGREETFTIRWPQDRVETGGLQPVAGASAEVFRLRDSAGNVIGLASRSTSGREGGGAQTQGTDWMLLLPSRGTLFMTQANSRDVAPRIGEGTGGLVAAADVPGFWTAGARVPVTAGPGAGGSGRVLGGSEEFTGLQGTYDETWELEEVAANGATRGHITLVTRVEAPR